MVRGDIYIYIYICWAGAWAVQWFGMWVACVLGGGFLRLRRQSWVEEVVGFFRAGGVFLFIDFFVHKIQILCFYDYQIW